MKKRVEDFAFFGGKAAFDKPLHVAQVNLPSWEKVESTFRDIFRRRYFANHGPLVTELDHRFAEFIGAKHAVCVTNGTVALMLLARALDLQGEVIVPAFTFPATVQALSWAGITPVLCDVDPNTHMVTPETIMPHVTDCTSGILAVHLWGRPCTPTHLESFAAKNNLTVFFDACHGIGCSSNGRRIGTFGAGEAFSFHATKIINGGEGGCITTNDKHLADTLKTIRSFHPSETYANVLMRMNGKMSEAQAALALLSLEEYPEYVAGNRTRYEIYRNRLSDIPGISLLEYDPGCENNYQYIVLEIDPEASGVTRDIFLSLLSAENIICRRHFYPGVHRMSPYRDMPYAARDFPGTDRLCSRLLQLPTSQIMTQADIEKITELIYHIHLMSGDILKRVKDLQ